MNLEAYIRNNKTKGDLRILRSKGDVPGIIYGGKEQNQKVSFSKKKLKTKLKNYSTNSDKSLRPK